MSYILFLTLLWQPRWVMAQQGTLVAERFNLSFKDFSVLTPAYLHRHTKWKATLGNQSATGVFSGFSASYVQLEFFTAANSHQKVSFLAFSDKEGEFFGKNRAYVRYAKGVKLSEEGVLSLGASAGLVNYAFAASQASPGGSATTFDGDVGVAYSTNRFSVGTSLHHIFQNTIRPLDYVFTLNAVGIAFAKYHHPISDMLETSLSVVQFVQATRPTAAVNGELVYNDLLSFGAGYSRGYIVQLGIQGLEVSGLNIAVSFAFFRQTRSSFAGNDLPIELFSGVYSGR